MALNGLDLEILNQLNEIQPPSTILPPSPGPRVKVDWAKVIMSILVCAFGILGNFIVMFVIFKLREYKKDVTHWYVLQLAIADTLFLVSLPFKVSEDINLRWIFPEWMCKAKETVLFLNYYASITFLMIMSIDRYLAVCHMFSGVVRNLRKMRVAVIVSTAVWIVCLCMCVPEMLYSAIVGMYPHCSCSYVFSSSHPKSTNITQDCIDQGFADNLARCTELLKPSEGGTQYCIVPNGALNKHLEELLKGGEFPMFDFGVSNTTTSNNSVVPAEQRNATLDFNDIFANFDFYSINLGSPAVFGNDVFFNQLSYDYGVNSTPEAATATTAVAASTTTQQANVVYPQKNLPPECSYEGTAIGWKILVLFNFAAMYVLPVMVMLVCYGLIIGRLSSSGRPDSSEPGQANSKAATRAQKNRKRVTIMCAALVFCFVVLWMPFHISHLAKMIGIDVPQEKAYLCRNLSVAGSLMAYMSSALNPYLYTILGGNFRTRFDDATKGIRGRFETSNTSENPSIVKAPTKHQQALQSQRKSRAAASAKKGHVDSSNYTNSDSAKFGTTFATGTETQAVSSPV